MQKKNRLIGTVVALGALLTVTACGSGASSTPQPSSSPAAGGASATPAATDKPVAKGEEVKLSLYSWKGEDKEAYTKIIKVFEEENPGIKVEFKPFKSTEYNTILKNALTAGSGVDILQLRPYEGAQALADANYIVALDDLNGIKNIAPEHLEAAKGSDGKVYGVPLMLNNSIIWYNKKMFEDNKLEEPKTYDEFIKVSEALKAKGIVPIAQSGKAAYLLSMTHSIFGATAYGGNTYVDSILKGDTNFKDPKFIESINMMKDLEKYFPKDFVAIEDKDAQAMFMTSKAAMYINGSHRLESFEKTKPDFPIDFIPALAKNSGDPAPIIAWVDGSYALAKSSKHQAEAMKFMEFLASPKFGQMYSDELNRISPINGVSPQHPLLKKMTELTAKSNTPYLMLTNFGGGTPTTKTTFEDSLQGMYVGKLTPEKVAEDTQASADKWFKPKK